MKRKLPRGAYLLIQRYFRHGVGVQSAALAFYLLFMIFPFLIFISALLGLLDLNVTAILLALGEFLPRDVVDIVRAYLLHVGQSPSPKLMMFGLFFSIWFPMRATNALMVSVRTAYHLGPPKRAVMHRLKTLLYTVVLISAIALTLALMTIGDRLLGYAVGNFRLPLLLAELWARMRFPAAAVVGYFALFFLRPGPGRPAALEGPVARDPGGPGGLDGVELAVRHVCGKLRQLLASLWVHRHGGGADDLAVHVRQCADSGGGAQWDPGGHAEGGGGVVYRERGWPWGTGHG